jgi:hypothetical protein
MRLAAMFVAGALGLFWWIPISSAQVTCPVAPARPSASQIAACRTCIDTVKDNASRNSGFGLLAVLGNVGGAASGTAAGGVGAAACAAFPPALAAAAIAVKWEVDVELDGCAKKECKPIIEYTEQLPKYREALERAANTKMPQVNCVITSDKKPTSFSPPGPPFVSCTTYSRTKSVVRNGLGVAVNETCNQWKCGDTAGPRCKSMNIGEACRN